MEKPDINFWKDDTGKLITWAWPGGYPVLYITEKGDQLCPDCANSDPDNDPCMKEDPPIEGYIHYEGTPERCDDCGKEINSAYGDPDIKYDWNDLNELMNSSEWMSFQASILGNDLFINDPERAERLSKYTEEGLNGSTPQEEIDDVREFLDTLVIGVEISLSQYEKFTKELDESEKWHEQNWSLNRPIGDRYYAS